MTRGQQRAHVLVWIAVGLAVALALAAGLTMRPVDPVNPTLPAALAGD